MQKVYAVVVALALGQAIRGLVTSSATNALSPLADVLARFPPFGSFLVVLIPFFHGMNRHLDRCYLDREIAFPRWGVFLFDFCIFFVMSSLLSLTALSLSDAWRAFALLAALLTLDVAWGFISHSIHPIPSAHPFRWALVNIFAVTIGVLVGLFFPVQQGARLWILFGVACARTIADYKVSWGFYFPGGRDEVATRGPST